MPMTEPTLTLPLRIGPDGRLARGNPLESLLALIHVMAATPAGSWAHARWFGLQEVFAGANPLLHDQQQIADALNRALVGLEITWMRVQSVTTMPKPQGNERRFHVTLAVADGKIEHAHIAV